MGQRLFDRGRRGVTLTPQGEVLYDYAVEIMTLVSRAEVAVTDVTQLGRARSARGVTPGIAAYLAPDWVRRFRSHYPQLTVMLQTGITGEIVPEVLSGHLDFG
ncbi:MAG: LysR family transcriptional regulator [Chloroflexota bacterium]